MELTHHNNTIRQRATRLRNLTQNGPSWVADAVTIVAAIQSPLPIDYGCTSWPRPEWAVDGQGGSLPSRATEPRTGRTTTCSCPELPEPAAAGSSPEPASLPCHLPRVKPHGASGRGRAWPCDS